MSDECLVMRVNAAAALCKVKMNLLLHSFRESHTTLDLNCIKLSLFRPHSSLKSHIGVTAWQNVVVSDWTPQNEGKKALFVLPTGRMCSWDQFVIRSYRWVRQFSSEASGGRCHFGSQSISGRERSDRLTGLLLSDRVNGRRALCLIVHVMSWQHWMDSRCEQQTQSWYTEGNEKSWLA